MREEIRHLEILKITATKDEMEVREKVLELFNNTNSNPFWEIGVYRVVKDRRIDLKPK